MLSGSEITTTEQVGRYALSHYVDNSEIVVVVFASAGARFGGPIEEFKGSLLKYGVSMLFVRDRDASWFHEPETPDMFAKVAEMVKSYKKVAVLGESMGGSGALIFPRFCDKIDRTLAFSPLYSFAYPFNQFAASWNNDVHPRYWAFDSENQKVKSHSVLLYGTRQWQDTAHAGLYSLQGYPVLMVNGSGHLVASYLKKGYKQNYLSLLLENFLDFSKPFNAEGARSVLEPILANYGIDDREWNFEASMKRAHLRVGDVPFAPPPPGCIDLASNRPTDQSSICQYSAGRTTHEDSARAVSDHVPEFYAFHTGLENNPWWKIDLEGIRSLEEIRIYNRIDRDSERGLRFSIEIRKNENWNTVFEKNNDKMFGGIDGNPFVWRPEKPLKAREVRIKSLAIEDFLHYQKIEIFGR